MDMRPKYLDKKSDVPVYFLAVNRSVGTAAGRHPLRPSPARLLCLLAVAGLGVAITTAMPPPRGPQPPDSGAASRDLLLPADHADASRLEADAHLNRDFAREILFGEAHDAIRPKTSTEARAILAALFPRIDANSDGRLVVEELAQRIAASVAEHEAAARESSWRTFSLLVGPNNASSVRVPPAQHRLSLRQYTIALMTAITGNATVAVAFADDVTSRRLSDDEARQLAVNHHRWAQADADADGWLDAGEFVCFQHSELCNATLEARLEDAFAALDRNSDGVITREEFVAPPESSVMEQLPFGDPADPLELRRQRLLEFDQRLDANSDDRADRAELRAYMQPDGAIMAAREAALLMHAADKNSDGWLSLAEVLESYSVFIGSKLVNTAAGLHEEL